MIILYKLLFDPYIWDLGPINNEMKDNLFLDSADEFGDLLM